MLLEMGSPLGGRRRPCDEGKAGSRGLPRGCAAIQAGASEGVPGQGCYVTGVALPTWPRCPQTLQLAAHAPQGVAPGLSLAPPWA